MGKEDYHDLDSREDVLGKVSQVGLFKETSIPEQPADQTLNDHEVLVGECQEIPLNFQEKLDLGEIVKLNIDEHPDHHKDYDSPEFSTQDLIRLSPYFSSRDILKKVPKTENIQFDNHQQNHPASLINFVTILRTNPDSND
jgi:hypothetical protein